MSLRAHLEYLTGLVQAGISIPIAQDAKAPDILRQRLAHCVKEDYNTAVYNPCPVQGPAGVIDEIQAVESNGDKRR
jgi:hypothetical protein